LTIILFCLSTALSTVSAQISTTSVPANRYTSEVTSAWFDLQQHLVQTTLGFSPPVASHAFGYSGVTLYEAIVPGMPGEHAFTF
jgi:hypothetical protein